MTAKRPLRRGIYILPTVFTLGNLLCGFTSIILAAQGEFTRAAALIVLAGVLDGLDGRIARALGATSRFGAELDSLSDFVCFGVAPAVVVYMWSLQEFGGLGWAISLLFAVCCGLRLARFNVALDSKEIMPPWTRDFFVGVPAPAGGGLAIMPLIFGLQFEHGFFASPWLNGLMLAGVAALMVSRVPTFAFKRLQVPGRHVVFALLAVGAFAAFLISTPWVTLGFSGLAYLASIPYARHAYQRGRRLGDALGENGELDEDEADNGAPDENLP